MTQFASGFPLGPLIGGAFVPFLIAVFAGFGATLV